MFEHAFEALVHSGFRGASGPNALLLVCAKCHVGDASYDKGFSKCTVIVGLA